MRIISDELYAKIIKILAEDEKVAVFQQLLLAPKAEPTKSEKSTDKGVENGNKQSNAKS